MHLYHYNNFWKAPWKSSCMNMSMTFVTAFYLLNCLITTAAELREQPKVTGLDYREGDELSWCLSCSNSLWQEWSCGLVHCPAGNATDLIWRVLASSNGISCWTPLKPQHSIPKPKPNPLANWFMQDGRKVVWSIPYVSVAFFPSLKQNFIAYHFSKVSSHPDCIFEINQLWQSGFSSVYSNCCCSCSFEHEIIKIVQSSHKMYSNNILNFQESTTILNACTKKSGNLLNVPHIYIYIYI